MREVRLGFELHRKCSIWLSLRWGLLGGSLTLWGGLVWGGEAAVMRLWCGGGGGGNRRRRGGLGVLTPL